MGEDRGECHREGWTGINLLWKGSCCLHFACRPQLMPFISAVNRVVSSKSFAQTLGTHLHNPVHKLHRYLVADVVKRAKFLFELLYQEKGKTAITTI